jgi:hypothetical protein
MDVMQVLAQARDSHDRSVCDVPAFGKDQIAQPRCCTDNLLDTVILQLATVCQIENAQTLVRCFGRKTKECLVGDLRTMR